MVFELALTEEMSTFETQDNTFYDVGRTKNIATESATDTITACTDNVDSVLNDSFLNNLELCNFDAFTPIADAIEKEEQMIHATSSSSASRQARYSPDTEQTQEIVMSPPSSRFDVPFTSPLPACYEQPSPIYSAYGQSYDVSMYHGHPSSPESLTSTCSRHQPSSSVPTESNASSSPYPSADPNATGQNKYDNVQAWLNEQSCGGTMKRKRRITRPQRVAANMRERRRMVNVNTAFDDLREAVPSFPYEKKISRIHTLQLAMEYIQFMTDILNEPAAEFGTPFPVDQHFQQQQIHH